ncbi:hypothetical protein TNCV_1964551 [Trichonephila clavipes]|nr:hypothetical protein TNCV_1964551 [Trichonephila clavipes]
MASGSRCMSGTKPTKYAVDILSLLCKAVGVFVGPDTHTCILQLQRNPFLTPEESNTVDRKMRDLRDLVAALWDKKLAFRTRERRKFWVFVDGPQRKEKKTSSEAVLRLNSASEKESVLLNEDQTDL